MRVQIVPDRVELVAGVPIEAMVSITNTGDIIGGYHLRVLGADPSWVRIDAENLSLFPDTTETVAIGITMPAGVPAGDRRIAVQVRELTAPQAISVSEIELVVPAQQALRLDLMPATVVCGSTGQFGLTAENTGNTTITAEIIGLDPESKLRFTCVPPVLQLAPGEHAIADLRVKGRRRWFGSPAVRPFGLAIDPHTPFLDASVPPRSAADAHAVGPIARPVGQEPEPLANGTMLQRPRIGRGALSLVSLLLAITVFAVVITVALSRLANVSAADRDLALQVAAAAGNTGTASGSSAIGGTVTLLTGSPAAGVTVEVFGSSSLTKPVSSSATADDGSFTVPGLTAGAYKLKFRGAGLAEVWYPSALTGADAEEITLTTGQRRADLKTTLGGLPATVSGQVIGADVAGAVLSISVPADRLAAGGSRPTAPSVRPSLATGSAAPSSAGRDAGPAAVLRSVPIAADGQFSLDDVPSPAVYELTVVKPGFASETQRIDLAGGESRTGLQLSLRTGDGLITGTVTSPDGPLGEAIVTATTGTTTVKTVTLTQGDIGSFTLRGLVTPGAYTVSVTATGYGTQTSTVSLVAGQKLTGLRFSLSKSSGSLSGVVTTLADAKPAAGVAVTVTAGELTLATVTQTAGTIGAWTLAGLPIPGVYTVTFTRADLQSQTVSVTLDQAGNASTGTAGISVGMRSAFATVSGTVSQRSIAGISGAAGEATVTLSSGSKTYTVTSTSVPSNAVGRFLIENVEPGTYTLSASRPGTSPTTVTVTVTAGQALTYDPVLIPGAGLSGRIIDTAGASTAGLTVELYESAEYPAKIYRTTVTGPDGSYEFTQVDAPQAYVVQVRSPLIGPLGSSTLVLSASQAGRLDLTVTLGSAATAPGSTQATTATSAPVTGASSSGAPGTGGTG